MRAATLGASGRRRRGSAAGTGQRGATATWRRAAAAAAALLLALAGCGGSGPSKPSAGEQRAALDRWETTADAACQKSNAAIAKRGWPANLIDLDRLTVRAVDDVRKASGTIQRLPKPKGSEARVAGFLASVKGLDPLMERLSNTTEKFKPEELEAFVPKLQGGLLKVEKAADGLGLRRCAAHDEHIWIPDAIRAPVFAQQLSMLERRINRRVRGLAHPVSSPQAGSRRLHQLSGLLAAADHGISKLKPPAWAETATDRYITAIRDSQTVLDSTSALLSRGALSPAQYETFLTKLRRASRSEVKRYHHLVRAIGALPTIREGGSDEAPAGGDTQSA
jgi:hypothetical protein